MSAKKVAAGNGQPAGKYMQVSIEKIMEPELPIREAMDEAKLRSLEESIAQVGLLQPIVIVTNGELYEIVAGHRRYCAMRNLGWAQVPALWFPERNLATEAAKLHENVEREDITAAEEAVFFDDLLQKHKLDEAGLCRMVRKSPDYVGDRLRLLRGHEEVFNALRARKITFAVARELNKITAPEMALYYLDCAIRSGSSSRVVADWVTQWRGQSIAAPPAAPAEPAAVAPDAVAPFRPACFCCGGDKDPYNLENVYIHKWELAEIRRILKQAAGQEA